LWLRRVQWVVGCLGCGVLVQADARASEPLHGRGVGLEGGGAHGAGGSSFDGGLVVLTLWALFGALFGAGEAQLSQARDRVIHL
jgi:hypothetical protein